MRVTPKTLRSLADGLAAQNSTAVQLAHRISRLEKLEVAVEELMPRKPDGDAKNGPCCFEFNEKYGQWAGTGCECGNRDDAQDAGAWAAAMNDRIVAERKLKALGLDDLISTTP